MNPLDMLRGGNPLQRLINARQPQLGGAAGDLLNGGPSAPQADPSIPLLDPTQEQSVLGEVSNAGLGALHFIGSTLDKSFGGRAVRGVLGGHPEELASVIPGSDWMGLSNEKNRVSGDDLLQNAGLLGKRDPNDGWLQARDLAGPAVEMALDPATYLTLGTGSALTETGQAAEKAGQLADTAAGRIGAGQSGLVGLGLPFSKPSVILGTGETGQKIGGLLDKGTDALLYGNLPGTQFSPGRAMSRLFDAKVGGTETAAAQKALRAMNAALPAGEAAARGRTLEVGDALQKSNLLNNGPEFRSTLEGTASALPGSGMDVGAQLARGHLDAMKAEARSVGRPVNDLMDEAIDYAPRQEAKLNQPTKGFGRGSGPDFPVRSANQNARIDPFKDLEGGTTTINAMSVDPAISGPNRTLQGPPGNMLQEQAYIRHNYLGGSPAMDGERATLNQAAQAAPLAPADAERLAAINHQFEKSESLAEIMAKMDPQRAANQLPYFGNHPLTDFGTYGLRHAKAQAAAEAVHNMLASSATVGSAAPGMVPIADALEGAGLTHATIGMQGTPTIGAQATMRQKLIDRGLLSAGSDLSSVRVPANVAADAARVNKGFQIPEALQPLVAGWDSFTNLNKSWMNSFWPASRARDVGTALWQNAASGAIDPTYSALNPMAHLAGPLGADALAQGKTVAGAAAIYPHIAGLTDEAATDLLRNEAFQHGVRGTGGELGQAAGQGTRQGGARAVMPNSPEAVEPGLLATANPMNAVPKSLSELNPLDVRGVGGRQETGNSLVKYGHDLSDAIDDRGRTGAFLNLRRQGYSAEAAAAKANATHYDYSNLSGFENQVMRRLMPYYNWTRQNVPYQLQHLLEHPGGLNASALKAADASRPEGFTPQQIAQDGGLGVGQEANGAQRFLTSLGLPMEDLADFVGSGQRPGQNLLEKVAGNLNPLIKAPLEYATNRQFISDRELTDLHSRTGNIAADQLIMNSPLQRFSGALSTAMDDRKDLSTKALNLLTPAKVTDVDMEKARSVSARDVIEESLRNNPNVKHFQELYVPKGQEQELSPEEYRMMQLYKTLEAAQSKRGKAAHGK